MENTAKLGKEYYTLVGEKNIEGIRKFLHEDVQLYGPLAHLEGKKAVTEATTNFMKAFKSLKIRAHFGAADQAMVVYDVDIPGITQNFPGASLLQFQDGLIIRIDLFYDGSRFAEKKKEIF